MKRYFPLFIGLCLLLVGITLGDTFRALDYDSLTVYADGTPTVYGDGDRVPSTRGKYVRADMYGDCDEVLGLLGAKEIAREAVDDMVVVYAFSPYISACETLKYGRVNVMIAVRDDGSLVVGCPLIKGSY